MGLWRRWASKQSRMGGLAARVLSGEFLYSNIFFEGKEITSMAWRDEEQEQIEAFPGSSFSSGMYRYNVLYILLLFFSGPLARHGHRSLQRLIKSMHPGAVISLGASWNQTWGSYYVLPHPQYASSFTLLCAVSLGNWYLCNRRAFWRMNSHRYSWRSVRCSACKSPWYLRNIYASGVFEENSNESKILFWNLYYYLSRPESLSLLIIGGYSGRYYQMYGALNYSYWSESSVASFLENQNRYHQGNHQGNDTAAP